MYNLDITTEEDCLNIINLYLILVFFFFFTSILDAFLFVSCYLVSLGTDGVILHALC